MSFFMFFSLKVYFVFFMIFVIFQFVCVYRRHIYTVYFPVRMFYCVKLNKAPVEDKELHI